MRCLTGLAMMLLALAGNGVARTQGAQATCAGDVPVSQYPVGVNHGPAFPEKICDASVEGIAKVACDVDTAGRTSTCKISWVTGDLFFGTSALQFVQNNLFQPATHCGVLVKSHRVWTYRFDLDYAQQLASRIERIFDCPLRPYADFLGRPPFAPFARAAAALAKDVA
jgi:TonB family protein